MTDQPSTIVAGLVAAGALAEAGVWERPKVDVDAMEAAKARYYRDNEQRLADEAAGRPWTQEMVDAMHVRARGWHDRRRIVDGPRFYFDGADLPEGAVPLYRIGGAQ